MPPPTKASRWRNPQPSTLGGKPKDKCCPNFVYGLPRLVCVVEVLSPIQPRAFSDSAVTRSTEIRCCAYWH